jgi:hypothetical protein
MIGRRAERERRLHARTSLGLKGTMAFDGRAPKRDCIIKNISERGACLDIGLLLDPPDQFSLMISASTNAWRKCRVIWRSQSEAGVFLLEARQGSSPVQAHVPEAQMLRTLRRRAFPRATD